MKKPRIALIQARLADDPMGAHEVRCFSEQCGLPLDAFRIHNLALEPVEPAWLNDCDAVMVGGSGNFSLVLGGFEWQEPMLELMRTLIARRMPAFASCFGFQALVQGLGGQLERKADAGEVGTFEITVAPEAGADPVFSILPPRFQAQLGHLDGATALPPTLINFACSELHPYQAVRVQGAPIVATQFHPELTQETNVDRFMSYLSHYRTAGTSLADEMAQIEQRFAPSPNASRLLPRFLEIELGYRAPKTEG